MLARELDLMVHLVGYKILIPGALLDEISSFIFWNMPSLRGECLISLVISRVVSKASFNNLHFFSVSPAARLRACPVA